VRNDEHEIAVLEAARQRERDTASQRAHIATPASSDEYISSVAPDYCISSVFSSVLILLCVRSMRTLEILHRVYI
jgi:hypothetical protein